MPLRTVTRAALLIAAAMTAAVCLSGDVLGAGRPVPMTEVVVTLKGAPLSGFGRTLQSAVPRDLHEAARGRTGRARPPCGVGRARSAGALALPPGRRRPRGRRPPLPGRSARARAGRRPCLAQRSVPRASSRGRAGADRRRQALGADVRDGGERHEDRDHRRRPRRLEPVLQPERLSVPTRLSEGPDEGHHREGDRAAHVRSGVDDVQVREHAVRPDELVPRDARCRDRRGRPRHERKGNGNLRRGAERTARELQGTHDPVAGLRPRREQRRDRRGDRGRRRRRHERDQPLAGRARDRPEARHRGAGDQRSRGCGRRTGGCSRQRLQ